MKTYTLFTPHARALLIGALLIVLCSPISASAATKKQTCSLRVTTVQGVVQVNDKEEIFVQKGNEVQIAWESTNAKKAVDTKGKTIALTGTTTYTPSKATTYSYKFSSGSKKVTCAVIATVVTGSINTASLTQVTAKPTISGKVSGTDTVQLRVYKEGSTNIFYTSKTIKVKKGAWKTKITKKLPDGTYDLVLAGHKDILLNTIATGTLTIGKKASHSDEKSNTTLVVEAVPLLLGGTARAGASLGLSYLQVINIGKEAVSVKGFSLKQNGSAPASMIKTLTVVDDAGGSRGSVGGVDGETPFKNGVAFIPVESVFAPGQMRLFTIKAVTASNIAAAYGTQFKIDVASVDAGASFRGAFPVRGVTWTLGL